jgi:hypothetical protein
MGTKVTPFFTDMFVEDINYNAANSEGTAGKMAGIMQFIKETYLLRFEFGAQGPYSSIVTFPVLGHGMSEPFPFDAFIHNVWVISNLKGTSGTTEVDIKLKSLGGSTWTSIFSITPKFLSTSHDEDMIDALGKVTTVPIGVTRPVLTGTPFNVNAGDRLRFDLISAMIGASDLSVKVDYRPR